MALKATKDTYGFENVGGVEVRRLIKAGDMVPSTYTVEDSSAVEEVGAASTDASKPTKEQKAAAEAATSTPTPEDAAVAPDPSATAAGEPDSATQDPAEAGAEAGTSTTVKKERKK